LRAKRRNLAPQTAHPIEIASSLRFSQDRRESSGVS